MNNEITDDELLAELWHWRIEDKLSWKFCKGILRQNRGIELETAEIKKRFERALRKYNQSKE